MKNANQSKVNNSFALKQIINYFLCFLIVCILWIIISSLFLLIYAKMGGTEDKGSLILFLKSKNYLIIGLISGILILFIFKLRKLLNFIILYIYKKLLNILKVLSGSRSLIFLFFAALTIILIFNLDNFPEIRPDENIFLQAPYNLVKFGKYATATEFNFLVFDKFITVGPTVLIPIAGMFKIFGIGLFQARFIIAVYVILLAWVIYKLSAKVYDNKTALISLLLFISMKENIYTARQVMGDYPGFLFFFTGLLLWFDALDRSRLSNLRLITSGIFFGLSFITKNTIFFVAAAFVVFWFFDLRYTKVIKLRNFLIPLIPSLVIISAWSFFQRMYEPSSFIKFLGSVHNEYFLFSPGAVFDNLKLVFSRPEFLLTFPAIILALTARGDNNKQFLKEAFLCSATLTWLFWWICFNPSFDRYLIFPAILSCLITARLIKEMISFTYQGLSFNSHGSKIIPGTNNPILLTIMTTFIIIGLIYPSSRIINNLKSVYISKNYISDMKRMAEYIDLNIDSRKLISSPWYQTAWDVAFLSQRTVFKISDVTQEKLAKNDYILFNPNGWVYYNIVKDRMKGEDPVTKFLDSRCILEKQIGKYRLYKVLKE